MSSSRSGGSKEQERRREYVPFAFCSVYCTCALPTCFRHAHKKSGTSAAVKRFTSGAFRCGYSIPLFRREGGVRKIRRMHKYIPRRNATPSMFVDFARKPYFLCARLLILTAESGFIRVAICVLYPNPSRNTCFFDKMHHFYRMFRKSVHSAFFDKNCLFPICIFYAILYSYVKRMHMYTFRKKGWRKNDENTKKIAHAVRACGRAADGMLPCDPRLPFVCVALRSANGRRSVCPFFPFGAVARRCDCRSAFAWRRTFV